MSEPKNLYKFWHTTKHDDHTVTEIEDVRSPKAIVDSVFEQRGFWMGRGFVPWHKINYIQFTPADEREVAHD